MPREHPALYSLVYYHWPPRGTWAGYNKELRQLLDCFNLFSRVIIPASGIYNGRAMGREGGDGGKKAGGGTEVTKTGLAPLVSPR